MQLKEELETALSETKTELQTLIRREQMNLTCSPLITWGRERLQRQHNFYAEKLKEINRKQALTEVEKAKKRLLDMKTVNFSIFRGSNPNVTAEQIATEINKALDNFEAGKFEEVK